MDHSKRKLCYGGRFSKLKRLSRKRIDDDDDFDVDVDVDNLQPFVIVKIEEFPASFVDVDAGETSPVVDIRCPKCGIPYKSKASMKNHVQVCKQIDQSLVSLSNPVLKKFRRNFTLPLLIRLLHD